MRSLVREMRQSSIWPIAFLSFCFLQQALSASAPSGSNTVLNLPQQELNALTQLRNNLNLTIAQVEQLRWAQVTPCFGNCTIGSCNWNGIACSGGHVTQIDISPAVVTSSPYLLAGQLAPLLDQLTQLTYLNMSGHTISGPLPGAWGNLTSLGSLDLSNNALTGSLPPQWSGLAALSVANLSTNQLTGAIPLAWTSLPSLSSLDLRSNRLCTDNATFSGPTVLQATNASNCTTAQIFASQAPVAAPGAAVAQPTPVPSPTPATNIFNPNSNAPILQMSTGINIAVSVVIGAFLLFGIVAGIFRVKRQQRAHQRWITGRMVELRQREAQEEATFRELLQKIVPPSIMLDPQGEELWLAHPDGQVVGGATKLGGEDQEPEWEAIGGGSTVTPTASLPDSTLSGSAAQNDAPSSAPEASTAANAGGSDVPAEEPSLASSPSRAATNQSRGASDAWQAGRHPAQMPPLREQYRYITEYHRRQRLGLRHKKVPLFTVDVFISDKGSLTYSPLQAPPLDGFRPAMETREVAVDFSGAQAPAEIDLPAVTRPTSRDSRDEKGDVEMTRMVSHPSFRAERSAGSTLGAEEIEARRRERIGRLRDTTTDARPGSAPPAPFVSATWMRRLFGMETLSAREERLRGEADQLARDQEVADSEQPVVQARALSSTQDAQSHR